MTLLTDWHEIVLSQQPRCYLKKANITLRLPSSKQNDALKTSVSLEGQGGSNRTIVQRLTGPMEGLTLMFLE